jgi:competence protein ComEC
MAFTLVLLIPHELALNFKDRLYIWNVGQGQWVTWMSGHQCQHFDMGGEQAPKNQILKLCRNRKNSLYLTHSDLDHISFVPWGLRNLAELCLKIPLREKTTPFTQKKLRGLKLCPATEKQQQSEIEITFQPSAARFTSRHKDNRNILSRVYIIPGSTRRILIPGDSTKEAEKIWKHQLPKMPIQILILGHHGSRTSTSHELLLKLPQLKMGVASARRRRYGHPHPEITKRLVLSQAASLSTEIWGNLVLEL